MGLSGGVLWRRTILHHAAHHMLRYAVLCQAAGDYEERSKKVLKKWGTYISVLAKGDLLATAKG